MLLYGSFAMPLREEFGSINSIPLFGWLTENPFEITWWLHGSIVLLSLLTANTVICSIESLVKKRERRRWLLIISPQIIHIGFLFIIFAHLMSSAYSFKDNVIAYEGSAFILPNDLEMRITDISIDIDRRGFISDWKMNIEYLSDGERVRGDSIKPNSPSFYKGLGIYLKDLQTYPFRAALLEISREPGAPWALIGGILFMVGTIMLLMLKIKKESYTYIDKGAEI
jgi:cytochrome c biogenesis protein ResB